MKKIVRLVSVVTLVLCLLNGCGNAESENTSISLAVIAGVHSNSSEIPLTSSTVRDALYNTCYSYGDITFINCDGNPQAFYQTSIPVPEVSGLSEDKKKTIAEEYTTQLQDILVGTTANVEEVDTLKAIQKAAQSLEGNDELSDKKLLILDSGLSTTGYMDYTKGFLNAKPEDVVKALEEAAALPELSEVDVIWAFCGEVSTPQKELATKQKQNLMDIWEAILYAGHAKAVTFTSDFSTGIPVNGMPDVSVVEVEEQTIQVETEQAEPVTLTIEKPMETIILDNSKIQFVGDKDIFVDPNTAKEVIFSVAEKLLSHPGNKVYVVGTTATGAKEFCQQLSNARAQAVIDVLNDFGVSENQMIPMGLGCEDPWHLDDLDDNGLQVENIASQNRKVLIIDVNGEDAKKLND